MKKPKIKKTNFLIIGMILFGIATILYGGYIIYEKIKPTEDDKKKEEAIISLNDDLKNTSLFSIKNLSNNLSLVAVDTNGEETIIYDFKNYDHKVESVKYFFDSMRAKIYLSIKSSDTENNVKFNIEEIDLTTNDYELNNLTEIKVERDVFDSSNADNIVRLGNYIYFANSDLYKLNLEDNEIEKTDISNGITEIVLLGYNDNILIYNKENEIYKLDTTNNKTTKIIESGILESIYNNEVLYTDNSSNTLIAKTYNLDSNENKQVIEKSVTFSSDKIKKTVPYKNSYINLNINTFYHNNKNIELTCDKLNIEDCISFSVNSYIVYLDNIVLYGVTHHDTLNTTGFTANIDLKTLEIKSSKQINEVPEYTFVTYIN